jgi:putative transposase
MNVAELQPGAIFVFKGRIVEIIRIDNGPTVIVRDIVTGEEEPAPPDQLHLPPALEASRRGDVKVDILADALPGDLDSAKQREQVILEILGSPLPRLKAIDLAASRHGLGKRSLRRWITAYQSTPTVSALLHRRAGNARGSTRLSKDVDRTIRAAIDELFLKRTHVKRIEVFTDVCRRCDAAGLKTPSRQAVFERIAGLDPATIAFHQLGGREARRRYGTVPGKFTVDNPLAVVQMDHTPVDVIVVDEVHRKSIGRPWLTVAIDVATRVILGIHLSLEAPSALSVALCLTHACAPKNGWLNLIGVDASWPIWGLPRVLHADNATEFKSEALRRGCAEYGIDIQLRPIGKPHYGGHIERLIGTLMGHVHSIPGTTQANIVMRRGADPEATATLTMAELQRWITLDICGRYHQEVHSGIHTTPLAVWQDAHHLHGAAPSIVANADEFLLHFLPTEQRSLQRAGLLLFHVWYWAPVLPTIASLKEEVLIRYDPRNLAKIFVRGRDKAYHAIPYADIRHPPITIWEHTAAVNSLRKDGQGRVNEALIFATVLKQRELIEQSSLKTKRARRQQQRQSESARTTPSLEDTSHDIESNVTVDEYPVEIWEPRE